MTGSAFFQGRCQAARLEWSDQLGRARACSQAAGGAIVPHLPRPSSPLEQRVCPRRLVPLVRPPKLKPAFRPARQSTSLGIQCMHANPWMSAHSTQSRDEPDNRRVEDTFQVHSAAGAIRGIVTFQGSSATPLTFWSTHPADITITSIVIVIVITVIIYHLENSKWAPGPFRRFTLSCSTSVAA